MEIIAIRAFRASTYTTVPKTENTDGTFDLGDTVAPENEDNNLIPWLTHFKEIQNLDEADVLTCEVHRGSPWHIEYVLNKGDRLVVYIDTDDDGVAEEWRCYRIRNITTGTGENSQYLIEAWSIDIDLTTKVWGTRADPTSQFRRTFDFAAFTVQEVLTELFGSTTSALRLGSVHSSIASLSVSPFIRNNTIAEAIGVLREELEQYEMTLEYEIVFNASDPSDSYFSFDFYHERGWNSAELDAGSPDPSLRIIASAHIGEQANRLGLQVQNVQDDYVSRVIPIGGNDEEEISIGGIVWDVRSATVSGSDQTTIILSDTGVIAYDEQFSRIQDLGWAIRGDTGVYYRIVGANASANRITVSGNASNVTTVMFLEYDWADDFSTVSEFRQVDYVRDGAGETEQGVSEKIETFPNVIPYPNLIEEAGGTGDLSTWTSGLPDGFEAHGDGVTITENSNREWINVGKRSAKVEAGKGEGIKASIEFGDDPLNPYASASAALMVEEGRVRMWMEDSDGKRFPLADEQQHEGRAGLTAALKLGGFDPAAGAGTIYIEAHVDDTVFYLDSIAVTQSPTAWDYTPYMGPQALHIAAVKWMIANGGIRPITTQATYVNLDFFGVADVEPIKIGSWCRIKDLKDYDASTFNLQLDGRIERLEHTGSGSALKGGSKHVATIGRQRESVIMDLQERFGKRQEIPEFPLNTLDDGPDVTLDLGEGIVTWQHDGMGFIRYTPPDPDRVTKFEVHISIGEPLPEPGMEMWMEIAWDEAGYYQTSFELDLHRLSWIRYRIELDDGETTPIIGEVSFDIDTIPELSNAWLDWIPISRSVRAYWQTDEDTQSVIYASSEVSREEITDTVFNDALAAGDFVNGNGLQNAIVDSDLLPGKTIYVGLRPVSTEVMASSDPDDIVIGTDVFVSQRVPSTGDQPTWSLDHSKSASVVTITLTIESDPAMLVTKVQERNAMGRVLTATDAYSDVARNAGTDYPHLYEKSVDISNIHKHGSYVQFKIVTVAGVDDIILAPFAIDPDDIAEANVTWAQNWIAATEKWEMRVAWAGDDDLQSIKIELLVGSDTHVANSNNTQDEVAVYSELDSDTAWRLKATGYTQDDQLGSSNLLMDITGRTPPTRRAPDLGQGIKTWQANGMGFLRYDPPVASRVSRFRVYKSSGAPLKQTIAANEWTEITADATDGFYQTSVVLTEKHLSWIRYEIQIDSGNSLDIVGEVSFDFDKKPEISNFWLDWAPLNRNVRISWLADEDVGGVVYAWNKTGLNDLNDAAFASSITNSRYINGNVRKSVTVAADLKPGETIYVGLRPFTEALTDSTDQSMATRGDDVYETLRIPATGELPIWSLDHSKSGSTVTLKLSIESDPAALVTKVQSRSSVGRFLTATDTYSDITRNAGMSYPHVYQKAIDISTANKHDSYIQFKIVTVSGVDDIILDPVTLDADNHPEALISWSHNWDDTTSTWDFRVAWSGDDDLGSITISVNGTAANSNNTQGQVTVVTGLESEADWTLVVTGYTEDNQMGTSDVILNQSGKTPPAPGADGAMIDISANSAISMILASITQLQTDIQSVRDDTEDWSSTVVFSAASGANRHNRIMWTAGTVTYLAVAPQNIVAGQFDLVDGARSYVYYDPDNAQTALRTTTDFSTATAGNAFIMCIAWPSVSGTDANFVSAIGQLAEISDIQANIGAFNLVTALQLTAAQINAILGVFTGSILLTGGANLVWGASLDSGSYTASQGAGYIDESGITFIGGGTEFYSISPGASAISIVHGRSPRLVIAKEGGGQGCYNGPFKVGDDLTAGDDLVVQGNLRLDGGNVEGSITKAGDLAVAGDVAMMGELTVAGDVEIMGELTVGGESVINPNTLTITETVSAVYSGEFLGSHITFDSATSTFVISSFPLGLSELVTLDGSGDGSTATQFVSVLSESSSGSGLQFKLSDLPIKSVDVTGSGTYLTDVSLGSDGVLTFTRGN